MIKKANDKWQMCIDYINLNRAYPKDAYPLPNIDRLVDGASGFQVLNSKTLTLDTTKSGCTFHMRRK